MLDLYDQNLVFDDLILTTQNGKPLTIQNLENTLKKICKRADLPPYTLHALRHTFATKLIRTADNMAEVKEIAEILGDSYEVIVRTYLHTDSEKKVDLVDRLSA